MERKLLLLGLLRSQCMYGYKINEMIDAHLGSSVELTKPTAYRFLNQMAENGWIRFTEEKDGNRPTRRVYSITPAGEEAFTKMVRQSLADFKPASSLNTIGIAFMEILPPEDAHHLLQERRALIEDKITALSRNQDHHGGMDCVISHQIQHLEADLDWLEGIMAGIQD